MFTQLYVVCLFSYAMFNVQWRRYRMNWLTRGTSIYSKIISALYANSSCAV